MAIPQSVQSYMDARWWLFLHIAPALLVCGALAGVIAWVYQNFYDN